MSDDKKNEEGKEEAKDDAQKISCRFSKVPKCIVYWEEDEDNAELVPVRDQDKSKIEEMEMEEIEAGFRLLSTQDHKSLLSETEEEYEANSRFGRILANAQERVFKPLPVRKLPNTTFSETLVSFTKALQKKKASDSVRKPLPVGKKLHNDHIVVSLLEPPLKKKKPNALVGFVTTSPELAEIPGTSSRSPEENAATPQQPQNLTHQESQGLGTSDATSFTIINFQENGEASATLKNTNEHVSARVKPISRKIVAMSAKIRRDVKREAKEKVTTTWPLNLVHASSLRYMAKIEMFPAKATKTVGLPECTFAVPRFAGFKRSEQEEVCVASFPVKNSASVSFTLQFREIATDPIELNRKDHISESTSEVMRKDREPPVERTVPEPLETEALPLSVQVSQTPRQEIADIALPEEPSEEADKTCFIPVHSTISVDLSVTKKAKEALDEFLTTMVEATESSAVLTPSETEITACFKVIARCKNPIAVANFSLDQIGSELRLTRKRRFDVYKHSSLNSTEASTEASADIQKSSRQEIILSSTYQCKQKNFDNPLQLKLRRVHSEESQRAAQKKRRQRDIAFESQEMLDNCSAENVAGSEPQLVYPLLAAVEDQIQDQDADFEAAEEEPAPETADANVASPLYLFCSPVAAVEDEILDEDAEFEEIIEVGASNPADVDQIAEPLEQLRSQNITPEWNPESEDTIAYGIDYFVECRKQFSVLTEIIPEPEAIRETVPEPSSVAQAREPSTFPVDQPRGPVIVHTSQEVETPQQKDRICPYLAGLLPSNDPAVWDVAAMCMALGTQQNGFH
ncbi:hypothetical protein L596_028760 [Steinernema carpocapsae]|uniref:Uncharacterized protein n=1 Tax=Steinernema carpocapsae TaxID=34508 RepID=A0A4U5LZB8_STECR|nr:hypothetical protein L596_028760 [Steinernema carpocapsae]